MFALSNQFLSNYRSFSDVGSLNPTTLLVYMTVAIANVQKAARQPGGLEGLTGTQVMPRDKMVPISRSAIAAATGLPRETVRRQVLQLIKSGVLVEERGGVALPAGATTTHNLVPLLDVMLKDFARTAEQLIRIGVIEVKPI